MRTLFPLPKEYAKRCVTKCDANFRTATSIISAPLPTTLTKGKVLVRNIAVGINASDVHYAAGVYRSGMASAQNTAQTSLDCGFEALSVVTGISSDQPSGGLQLGEVVLVSSYSAFGEFQVVSASSCFPVRSANSTNPNLFTDKLSHAEIFDKYRQYLPLTLSGATALLSIAVAFRALQAPTFSAFPPIQKEEEAFDNFFGLYRTNTRFNTLITAAAGGVGHLLTQLTQHYFPHGNTIAVTSTDIKKQWLEKNCFFKKQIDSERKHHIICYNNECLDSAVRRITESSMSDPRPTGPLNLVFDSVGSETLQTALRYASTKSTTMILGSTSQYANANWSAAIRGEKGSAVHSESANSSGKAQSAGYDTFSECPYQPQNSKQSGVSEALSMSSKLLTKSSSMVGFFLPHYAKYTPRAVQTLIKLTDNHCISPRIDDERKYVGLEAIPDAVEYLYSKKSCGKVVVRLV